MTAVEENPDLGFLRRWCTLRRFLLDEAAHRGRVLIYGLVEATVELDGLGEADRADRDI